MDKVMAIKALNRRNLESLNQILMDNGLPYAARGLMPLRGVLNSVNLFLVKIGNDEWHSWHILNVDATNNKDAVIKINREQFEYVVNGIPCTESIDNWII